MVIVRAVKIFGDIHVLNPYFAIIHITECINKGCFPLAYGFDFRAGKHYPGCKCVGDGIVECGTTVFYIYFLEFHFHK